MLLARAGRHHYRRRAAAAAPRPSSTPRSRLLRRHNHGLAIDAADVLAAAERVRPHVHKTPVLTSSSVDALANCELLFKAELFQRTGAFKIRGAVNAVFGLDAEAAARGCVTQSSGNHGAAIALACKLRGIPAHVVVPDTTPACKVDAIRAQGARVVFSEQTFESREAVCAAVQDETGATYVPPYNHPMVMAGQGTLAVELLEQAASSSSSSSSSNASAERPVLDAIVVPISGGGMISGIAVAAKAHDPRIKIIAAEPRGHNGQADVALSKRTGELRGDLPQPTTMCDGLRGRLGDLTWPVLRDVVDDVFEVDESEVVDAMALVYERLKVVVEPSGAVGLAAVLGKQGQAFVGEHVLKEEDQQAQPPRIGVVLCGGNLDMADFWSMLRRENNIEE